MTFKGKDGEILRLENLASGNSDVLTDHIEHGFTLLWFDEDGSEIEIDSVKHTFSHNQIICLTEFHKVVVKKLTRARLLQFNRPFYCIIDHDSEVGCKGLLFFGAARLPVMWVNDNEHRVFDTVWTMFELEMESRDNLQMEMLQMMLKRFLILCTRAFKEQQPLSVLDHDQTELVRSYNFLVEQHFRTNHTVGDYADMMHRSPKTLAHIFAQAGNKTPLQLIHERIMLEARRLLRHSEKPVKEIAYELGYEDIQSFSRFFRSKEGIAPLSFRKQT